jgi:hypothetical protein
VVSARAAGRTALAEQAARVAVQALRQLGGVDARALARLVDDGRFEALHGDPEFAALCASVDGR